MKLLILLTITVCGINVGLGMASFFDLEELDGFHYSVNFMNNPLNEEMIEDAPTNTVSLPMRNALGQPFHCIMPSPEVMVIERMTKPTPPEVSPDMMKDILALLNPLTDHPCLKRAEGYWEYELCYGQYIKQYHSQDNKPLGDIIILGNYDVDYTEKEHSKNRLLRHYSQYYINGSICDELGTPRKAEVRYVCDPATPSEVITSVDEPVLCEYVLTVKTSRTCSFPQMMPIPKSQEKSIDCFPLLTPSQFSDYMERKSKEHERKKEPPSPSGTEKILRSLSNEKVSEKLIDELVSLIQSSISESTDPTLTFINAQKYLKKIVGSEEESPFPKKQEEEAIEEESFPDKQEEVEAIEEDSEIQDMINESSELMKKLYEKYSTEELAKIMEKVERGAESSVDEILQEAAEDLKVHLKPLEKAEAAQVLSSSLDSLMDRIKSAIKDVDKGIQDIEEVVKEDKELLQDLESSLEADEALDEETSTDILPKEDEGKHDGKRSVKKDLSLQEEGYEGPPLDDDGAMPPHEEEDLQKSFDHIISSVQSKINKKMGSIHVKVVSTSGLDEDLPSGEEDEQYYSRMVYESLVGNSKAYEDIRKYRRDRRGYLFTPQPHLEEDKTEDNAGNPDGAEQSSDKSVKNPGVFKIRLPAVMRKALPKKIENNAKNIQEKKNNIPGSSKDQVKQRPPKDDL